MITTRVTTSILLVMISAISYGQNARVKKEVKVTTTFNNPNNSRTIKDTIISEYSPDGKQINTDKNPYINFSKTIMLDSIVTLSRSNKNIHLREYWSDTTFKDMFIRYFPDFILKMKVSNGDTFETEEFYNYNMNGNDYPFLNYGFSGFHKRTITFKETNKKRDIATVITTSLKNGLKDTVKINLNKKRRIFKTLYYNYDKNEWFTKEIIRYKKSKRIVWETSYHNYHKRYFTKRTTTNFNKFGLPIKQTVYDTYLKFTKTETIYQYQYH